MEQTVDKIYDSMLREFQSKTGLEASNSVDLSVRLYAVAAQIHALYAQGEWTRNQCFPQTAQGIWLDQHAQLRGLERREAKQATGFIRFSVDRAGQSDLTIEAGTVCMTAGQVRFETLENAVLQAGALDVEVPAQAVAAGTAGNVAAGSILAMAVPPVGVSRCTNPEPFTGGTEEEDDESLRSRVLETYRRMANGANVAYYEKEALSFEEVAAVTVVGRSRGIGTVDVVVAPWKGLPDEELLEQLQQHFEERREIAVDIQVLAPSTQNINVTVALKPAVGSDYETVAGRVETVIRDWFGGERLGESILRAKLGELIYHVEGVENYQITAPAADVSIQPTVLPQLGTLTLSEQGG